MDNLNTLQKAMHTIEISFAIALRWWRSYDKRKTAFISSFDNHTKEAHKVYSNGDGKQLQDFVQDDIYIGFRETIDKMKTLLTKITQEYESIKERMEKAPLKLY